MGTEERLSPSQQTVADVVEGAQFTLERLQDGLPPALGIMGAKLDGALGLAQLVDSDADPYDRVSGAVDFVGGQIATLATITQELSGGLGALGVFSGALATVGAPLTIISMSLTQFAVMGAPYYKAEKSAGIAGKTRGFYLGIAAGATGMDTAFVTNALDVFRHRVGGDPVDQAYREAHHIALWAGFRIAESFSLEQKGEWVREMIGWIVATKQPIAPRRDDYATLTHALAAAAEGKAASRYPNGEAVEEAMTALFSASFMEIVERNNAAIEAGAEDRTSEPKRDEFEVGTDADAPVIDTAADAQEIDPGTDAQVIDNAADNQANTFDMEADAQANTFDVEADAQANTFGMESDESNEADEPDESDNDPTVRPVDVVNPSGHPVDGPAGADLGGAQYTPANDELELNGGSHEQADQEQRPADGPYAAADDELDVEGGSDELTDQVQPPGGGLYTAADDELDEERGNDVEPEEVEVEEVRR